MTNYPNALLTALFAFCITASIYGQQTENNPPDSLHSIRIQFEEVEILDSRIRSLNNYTRLSSDVLMIEDGQLIYQSLNLVPGVAMQSGALNTNRITIRGIGNRSLFSTAKIKAYLDDIPLTNGTGETTIEDIDLSVLERVDVWKGPTASRYGAGLGGMIHLQTPVNIKDDLFIASGLSFRSYGGRRFVEEFYYGDEDRKTDLYLNYNKTHSDGYRANNEYDRESILLLHKSAILNGKFTLLMSYTDVKAFIPSSLSLSDYLEQPEKAAFTWNEVMGFEDHDKWLLGASFIKQIDAKLVLKIVANISGLDNYELRPFNILTEDNFLASSKLEFSYKALANGRVGLNFGAEIFRDQYDWETHETLEREKGDKLSMNNEERTYQNIFIESTFLLSDRWQAKASMNFNHTKYKLNDLFDDSIDLSGVHTFKPILSPRAVISYAPVDNMQIYASASHGFSPPTLEETLTPDGNINPDLAPEQGWNFEVGSRGQIWRKRLTYEITLYNMLIKDLLVARRIDLDQYFGINAGKTRHSGVEAELSYKIIDHQHSRIQWTTGYHYQNYRFTEFLDGNFDFSGNELTGTSPHTLHSLIQGSYRNFYGNILYRFVDAQPLRDDNTIYSDSYDLLNLKAGYRVEFGLNWRIDLYAGISNVLNEKYASMYLINASSFGGSAPRYYYPGLPRNYYGGLKVTYHL